MPSHIDWVRDFCRALPHTTEDIQWGGDLLFRIAKKIYCVAPLEPESEVKVCFKCTPEKFAELVEVEGIIPAPYMARNHWVAMTDMKALRQPEMKELIRISYQLVFEKLPKKMQAEMSANAEPKTRSKTKAKTKTYRR
jgi:predicted DNA-binding protein (MmcQ/YjbR family)